MNRGVYAMISVRVKMGTCIQGSGGRRISHLDLVFEEDEEFHTSNLGIQEELGIGRRWLMQLVNEEEDQKVVVLK